MKDPQGLAEGLHLYGKSCTLSFTNPTQWATIPHAGKTCQDNNPKMS